MQGGNEIEDQPYEEDSEDYGVEQNYADDVRNNEIEKTKDFN